MNVSIAQIIAKDENHVWLPERRKVKKKEYKKAGNESLHEYPIILRREREQEESVGVRGNRTRRAGESTLVNKGNSNCQHCTEHNCEYEWFQYDFHFFSPP